jgi:quinol-cytochrome oxidoreductase complex cytochrome b subunit
MKLARSFLVMIYFGGIAGAWSAMEENATPDPPAGWFLQEGFSVGAAVFWPMLVAALPVRFCYGLVFKPAAPAISVPISRTARPI